MEIDPCYVAVQFDIVYRTNTVQGQKKYFWKQTLAMLWCNLIKYIGKKTVQGKKKYFWK